MPLSVFVVPFVRDTDLNASLQLIELDLDQPKIDADHPLLVLHSRPELALARGLATGLSPSTALAQWQQSMQRLLSVTREHRRFCLWVELEAVLQHPDLLLQQLGDRNWKGEASADLGQLPAVHDLQPAPFFVLLATQLVNESTSIQALLSELEACSLPLSEERHYLRPAIDFESLLTTHVNEQAERVSSHQQAQDAAQEIAELKQDKAAVREENELLIAQLHQVQEELEAKLTQVSGLEKEVEQAQASNSQQAEAAKKEQAKLQQELAQVSQSLADAEKAKNASQKQVKEVQTQVAELKKAKSSTEEENELLIAQLHQVQEELEAKLTQVSGLEKELEQAKASSSQQAEAAKKEQAKLQQELAQVIKALAELKQAKASTEEENELLIAQLHQVQEELERQLLLAQQTRQRNQDPAEPKKQLPAVIDPQVPQTSGLFKFIKGYKEKRKQLRKAALIANSRWFIEAWYLDEYPDVAKHPEFAANPALHYLKFGGFEGRNPGPEFYSAAYLERYPDVAEQGINPLWHYMTDGKKEGRDISV